MKHVIPLMDRQGGGSIINISSVASIRYSGIPYATYYATKAALNHLTRTTAVEYANKRVRVNAILPGLMKTPMVEKSAQLAQTYAGGDVEEMWRVRDRQVPMGFGGEAWDVAWAAVYLATFRRKIGGFMNFDQRRDTKRSPSEWPTGSAGRKIAGADLWA
jgi:NAD(P)-dependent dehydrogenase (short-subunit alcohol dehydrogenase family)